MDKILMTKIVVMYGMFMILANFGKLDSTAKLLRCKNKIKDN